MNITIQDSQATTVSRHYTQDPEIAIQRAIAKRYGKRARLEAFEDLNTDMRIGIVFRGQDAMTGWVGVGFDNSNSTPHIDPR